MNNHNSKGVILVVALAGLIILAVFFTALTYLLQNETKWSVKHKKTTTAFQMAEQGLDRGVWKLQESTTLYTIVSTGGIIPGYNFDSVYKSTSTDGALGEYKINLTTSSTSGRVLVQAKGRDITGDEMRSLEAEFTNVAIDAGLHIRSGLTYKSGTRVHWGPIVSYGTIDLPNAPDNGSAFPRKYAKGSIDERPPTSASGPHGDTAETWNGTYDYYCHASSLDTAPDIDLDQYRTLAKNSSIPDLYKANGTGSSSSAGRRATASPVGSGYFPATEEIALKAWPGAGAYVFKNSTSVIFLEADYSFNDRHSNSQVNLRGFIAPYAALSVNGDDDTPNMVVRIPDDAQKEYLYNGAYGNSTLGWTTAQGTNATAFSSTGAGNNFIVADVLMRGYLYFENISNSGTNLNVVGILDMAQATNPQSVTVYYDSTVSTGIITSNQAPRRLYWREVKSTW